jgi:hypothetical protein
LKPYPVGVILHGIHREPVEGPLCP